MRVPEEVCRDHTRSSKLEWLEANGAGGFAMGTVAGTNTRRYHGLLVASLRPPVDRHVLLSRLDESVSGIELASNQYPGTVSPRGHERLVEFRLDPFPTWVYDIGGARIEKQLFLVPNEQTVAVTYRSTQARRLTIAPFLAFRDYHSLSRATASWNRGLRVERAADATIVRTRPYSGMPELSLHVSPGAEVLEDGTWYYNTEYLMELDRGLDFREDLWKLCTLGFDLEPEKPVFVVATLGRRQFSRQSVEKHAAGIRRQRGRTELDDSADQFLVRRADGRPTVIAGYPWFTDWGRDTMIALPGLCIARGRLAEAREVLRGFLGWLDRGLIPNAFPDRPGDKLEYNTADATLWMFQAVRAYVDASNDTPFLRGEFLPKARDIIRWHRQGTLHGIKVDPGDRLLSQGEAGLQLTWMDARVNGRVITPRRGKAVELNALWYNALRLMARWGDVECGNEADLVEASFEKVFWNEERGCLRDVHDDDSVRPNQLFALSLPYPLLPPAKRRSIVKVVQQKLLTPFGLRTLAPDEPGYVPRYRGGPGERDSAYHQGTVWPWLLGPFVRAYLCAFGRSPETIALCRALLTPLEKHLAEGCLRNVPEVFDAEPPFRAGGTPAQAWSVAELSHLLNVELRQEHG
jgi:predicted glycogen debranching enzyme